MNSAHSRAERRIATIFSPIMTAAAFSVLLAGCGASAASDGSDTGTVMSSSSSSEVMMDSSSSNAMMSSSVTSRANPSSMHSYKDGTYAADGQYVSPAGGENVHVSLTIKNDTVTDATFSGDGTNPKTEAMQTAFAAGFKEQVVGKSLGEVNVGVVNGSSLTGGGFNDAVVKIRIQAKA